MSTQEYTVSSLVGGQDGAPFGDIMLLNGDGAFILSDSNNNQIDATNPIANIDVFTGEAVDGIAVTYNLVGGGTITLPHGSGPAGRTTSTIALGATEKIVAVHGRAGPASGYERTLVITFGAIIIDTANDNVRLEGPFGDMHHGNEGTPYYSTDPLAFGGFADDTAPAVGLGGLFFYKTNGQK